MPCKGNQKSVRVLPNDLFHMTVKEAMIQTGRNLHRIRTAKSLSVETLPLSSGVYEALISSIESGDADFQVKVIFDLAAALNVDFREIMVNKVNL